MQQEVRKHKIVERYLNKVAFNGIRIGSLIAQHYALNIMGQQHAKPIIGNLLVFLKYVFTLWQNNKVKPHHADFLFTKLNNRFHFNALIDPLINHYYAKSIIVCDEDSFDENLYDIQDIKRRAIQFNQTNSNDRKDASKILKTVFTAFFLLIKNRKRLRLSFSEVIYFNSYLLIQLRRASFWNHYFSVAEINPLCVVTEFDRNNKSAPLVLAARKHKIQTITLIHGVLEDYGFTPFLADYIFCWGENQKSQLIARCVDPKRIFITGNPMFDNFAQKGYTGDHTFKGITICLAISPGFDNRLLIKPFASALGHNENFRGILKLHPSLSKDDYKWVEAISAKVEVLSSLDIKNKDLFKNIDLLIINDSGIANEALVAGVPVAVFVQGGIQQLNDFQNELIFRAECRLVTDESGLTTVFNDILNAPVSFRKDSEEKSRGYLKNLYYSAGEESVRAMVSQIDLLSTNVIPDH